MRLGAQTALMDEAWWLPSPKTGRFGQSTLDQARQRPRTIYVDAAGRRFVNESNSYMEVGKAMYERDKTSRAVPCWLIFDDRYRKRYAHVAIAPRALPPPDAGERAAEEGVRRWPTSPAMCGIDADGLVETVEHFNEHAAKGVDPDYGRGESAYNRSLGDPNRKVHPCLGPIDEAPYYACEVLPGDIGTCGGLLTDEHARVLDEQGRPDRGPLRHRQQHRHGHGPPLPRPGGEHRQHDGVRVRRGPARGRGGAGWLTSSRRRYAGVSSRSRRARPRRK